MGVLIVSCMMVRLLRYRCAPDVTAKNTPPLVQREREAKMPEDEEEVKEKSGRCGFDSFGGEMRMDSLLSTPRMNNVRGKVDAVAVALNSPITRTTSSDE